ncbi:MAG: helix-turn-helix domain-containing protein [Bdellovibrionales bacterium]
MEDKIVKFKVRGKTKTRILSKEALALKKIRINKRITREDAARALDSGSWAIERIENGRVGLCSSKLSKLLRRYKVSMDDFNKILSGETELLDINPHFVHRKHNRNYKRRFDEKIITKESRVLTCLRKMSNLSQERAATLCGIHRKSIGHIEAGRVDVTPERVSMIIKAYSRTMEEYYDLLEQDILRDEVIEECNSILELIEADKLKAVQALLVNFK